MKQGEMPQILWKSFDDYIAQNELDLRPRLGWVEKEEVNIP